MAAGKRDYYEVLGVSRDADPQEINNLVADPSASLTLQEMNVKLDSLLAASK